MGIDNLKQLGTEYAKLELFREKPPVPQKIKYNEKQLLIGRYAERFMYLNRSISNIPNPDYGQPFYLDLHEAVRILVVGITGGGKTFLLSSIASRLMATNTRSLLFLNDCKREFAYGRRKIQSKFRHLLFDYEVPEGFKVASLRPTYFKSLKNLDNKKHQNDYWYSPTFSKMTKNDFTTLMGGDKPTQNLAMNLEVIYDELERRFKREPDIEYSSELMDDVIESVPNMNTATVKTMKFKFQALEKSNLFDKKYEMDLTELIRRGFYPSINMDNYQSFSKSAYDFNNFTLSLIQQEIVMARASNPPKIKPLFVFFDELARFITKKKENSIKENTVNNIGLYRAKGISYCLATQNVEEVPITILKQCKYLFVPQTADTETIKTLLVSSGIVKNEQIAKNDAIRLKARMKDVKFSWICINRFTSEYSLIVPAPPVYYLKESSQND